MSTFMKRYGFPFLVMIISGLLVRFEGLFLTGSLKNTIVIITIAICLFAFGISVNISKRKRNETWLKKIFISFFLIFFIFWDLGYVVIPQLKNVFEFIGIDGFVINMLYIYLGFIFFD